MRLKFRTNDEDEANEHDGLKYSLPVRPSRSVLDLQVGQQLAGLLLGFRRNL